MSSLPPDDARLESLLRHEPAELPDAGFTLRVMQSLPPRPSVFARRRLACCVLGAAAGLALSLDQGASVPSLAEIGRQVESLSTQAAAFLANPWAVVGLLAVAAAAFLAWQSGDVEGA